MSEAISEGKQATLVFADTDLEIKACLVNAALTIEVLKSGACVYRVVLDHAADPIEHAWLADLFARDERVPMQEIADQVEDYVASLNTSQG